MSIDTNVKLGGISTTAPLGVQFNDQFWSKVAIKEAKRKLVFSQLGNKLIQPKNYGDKIVKYHELPIIHPSNINDQGIDAKGTKLVSGVWYAYTAADVPIVANADAEGATAYSTRELALANVPKDGNGLPTGRILSGNGNLFGGDTDYSTIKGSFPALREEGGIVNAVGMKRETLEAQVEEFGFHIPFTKKMLDMDTEKGLLARISREIGVAQAEVREQQIQSWLVDNALDNAVYAGAATSMATVDKDAEFTYVAIRAQEQALKAARSPRQTRVITATTKVGTLPVGPGYFAYAGQELYPTFEDMTHGSVNVWRPWETYADASSIAEGEIGKISATRIIEVEDMISFQGAGATVAADADGQTEAEAAADEAGLYHSSITLNAAGDTETEKYDVFPMLYVGTDSFATVGFEGDVAKVQTAMPKIIPGVDAYGKNGLVSISYYFGAMLYRPERLGLILGSAKIL